MEAGMTFTIGGCFKMNVLFIPGVLCMHSAGSRPWDKGWGGSHPDPEIRGRSSPKIFFQPFRPQLGLQNKEGLGLQTPPLDPPLKFITNRGWARILRRWGSPCVTPRVFTWLACRYPYHVLLKVTFFFRVSSERGGRDKPTRLIIYAMWNLITRSS